MHRAEPRGVLMQTRIVLRNPADSQNQCGANTTHSQPRKFTQALVFRASGGFIIYGMIDDFLPT